MRRSGEVVSRCLPDLGWRRPLPCRSVARDPLRRHDDDPAGGRLDPPLIARRARWSGGGRRARGRHLRRRGARLHRRAPSAHPPGLVGARAVGRDRARRTRAGAPLRLRLDRTARDRHTGCRAVPVQRGRLGRRVEVVDRPAHPRADDAVEPRWTAAAPAARPVPAGVPVRTLQRARGRRARAVDRVGRQHPFRRRRAPERRTRWFARAASASGRQPDGRGLRARSGRPVRDTDRRVDLVGVGAPLGHGGVPPLDP